MQTPHAYRLLEAFRGLFHGVRYLHRSSTQGDRVAFELYEDLLAVGRSRLLQQRIVSHESVLNVSNLRQGVRARRGDGTFGELIPNTSAILEPSFAVARGPIATVEIGVEVKILQKAMIKQIDRVRSDLVGQIDHFRRGAGNPICVGIVGINQAPYCMSYEGERQFLTDGHKYVHPCAEAAGAERYLMAEARPKFDEFLVLRYKATNEEPYPFAWVDFDRTFNDYGAILARVSREYDTRFGNAQMI